MASLFTRRVIAYLLDFFVVSALMWVVSYLLFLVVNLTDISYIYKNLLYFVPVVILVYFVLCEKIKGASVGKAILYLQVRSNNGAKISWVQAIIRNLTKIYWIPMIFDWLIGKILKKDRLFNVISKTVVIDEL